MVGHGAVDAHALALHSTGQLFLRRRLVQETSDTAAAHASEKLHDPEGQDSASVSFVGCFIGVYIFVTIGALELGPSRAEGRQLAHGVEAEHSRGDEGGEVDAAEAAATAAAKHAGLQVVGTNGDAQIGNGDHDEGNAAESINNGVAAA